MRNLFTTAVLLAALLAGALPAEAALRISGRSIAPFDLPELAVENNTSWYDAGMWLSQFPGQTKLSEDGVLSHRVGKVNILLRSKPPFVERNGKALRASDPPRILDGRLLVSEKFIRETGSDLVDQRVESVRTGGGRRIVIDPDNGGSDTGDKGNGDLLAKDAVLVLAQAIARELTKAGHDVHLTRHGDETVDIAHRAATANYWQADLFLSLQATGLSRPKARGFEIFYPPAPPEGADPGHWYAGQAGRAANSRLWAQALRAAVGESSATYDRGITELPSPLLDAVASPAAILVVGNLAWPQEAELFTDEASRDRLAAAVASAAQLFFQR
jgi:N-acetylmuramoyl-L-alanine amidase